jgi:sigma-E factor negative regulatory protein RseB
MLFRCLVLRAATGLVGAAILTGAHAEPAAGSADWLARMAQAVRTENYQGVMVYAQSGRMESMRIVHRYQNGREQERLKALTGDAREIHRDNDLVTCYLPKDRAVKIDRKAFSGLLPALSGATADSIADHYELQELGKAKILGRSCRLLSVKPRDALRYGHRMWVDEATGLPLKAELIGARGRVLEQMMFTEISFPARIDDRALRPEIDAKNFHWIRHDAPNAERSGTGVSWRVVELPPGFRTVVHELQLMPNLDEPVEHMVFTDGLATVSAFMAPKRAARKFEGFSRMGAMTAYARTLDNFHVTVVGEVPTATVEMIAEQLRYDPTGPLPTATPAPK